MTLGPVVCAAGLLVMLRIGPGASYLTDVLPGVAVFGLGLAIMVAPLTATALAAAPDEHAGLASGVNNAVARAAGLIAIAVLPAVAGIGGEDYTVPAAFDDGFQTSLYVAAGILLVGALIAATTISNDTLADTPPDTTAPSDTTAPAAPDQPHPVEHGHAVSHCAMGAPPLQVRCDEVEQTSP
jgi:hypothetical protein